MKLFQVLKLLKYMTFLAISMVILPVAVFAATPTGMPQFGIVNATNISGTMVRINASFNSADANFDISHRPTMTIHYTNTTTGVTSVSSYNMMSMGSDIIEFTIYNLDPGTTYTYRAMLMYNGLNYASQEASFTTKSRTVPSVDTNSDSGNSNDVVWEKPKWLSWFSSTPDKVTSAVKSKVVTGGATHKNRVALSITNEQAVVSRMDSFTYTISYDNTNGTSLKNAEINVQLPEDYEFVKSPDDADYDRNNNIVTFTVGRVIAGPVHSVSFTARAIGSGKGEVETLATLSYDGGSVSTSDRDSYDSGSKSVLGASVFGAGFFPQTLGGWMIIILIIFIVVIVARRYATKPAPKPEDKKPA
jgi:hypothetical protein